MQLSYYLNYYSSDINKQANKIPIINIVKKNTIFIKNLTKILIFKDIESIDIVNNSIYGIALSL